MTRINQSQFDNPYQNNGLPQINSGPPPAQAKPVGADAVIPVPNPTLEPAETAGVSTDNITEVSDAGSRKFNFVEGDLSFGKRLSETNKTNATQKTREPILETDNPADLGAAKMLSEEGKMAYQEGDFATATLYFEAACDYDKKSPVLAYNLACTYQKTGDTEAAEKMFAVAKELDPLNLELSQRIEDKMGIA
jgi:tetratricopeptide (TPR) repeat protein